MSLSGHKTRSIFDRYNIVNEADLAQATELLHSHLQKQPKAARLSAEKGGWMREHGQNTDNLRTAVEQAALRSMNNSLKGLEKFGGPPETRTPDPLIKSQLLYQLS
jgi:hypothetical protein